MKKMPQNRPRARRKAGLVSLGRALSKLGVLSRAQAITAVLDGRVRVNGRVERNPAVLVAPERTRLLVDGKPAVAAAWRTLLFHKPRGVVTTRIDPEGRRTIYDVLGEPGQGLIAVGRLDLATSGLLLLTSDTRLADWIADPAHAVPRVYAVTVRGRVSQDHVARLMSGEWEPHGVAIRKASGRETHLVVELRQGRNREVRRLFGSIDREVTRLVRIRLGGLELGSLEPGQWREASRQEIQRAFPEYRMRHAEFSIPDPNS